MKTLITSMFLSTIASVAFANNSASRIEQFATNTSVPRINTVLLTEGGSAENLELKRFLLEKPKNPAVLYGKRIAIIATDGVEEIEVTGAQVWLKERGAQVELIAPRFVPPPRKLGIQYPEQRQTHILAVRFMENAGWLKIDRFLDDAKPELYDAIIVPGGTWNPDVLRRDRNAIAFLESMHAQGKPVAAICHGPWVLIEAGLLHGKSATANWNIETDIRNAGATFVDQAVAVDGNIITSRYPYDLPQFLHAIQAAVNGNGSK